MRIATTCLTLLLLGTLPIPALAHGNEPHAEGAAHDDAVATTVDAKVVWQTATGLGQQVETATKANDFAALHDLTEKLIASLQQLKLATADIPEQRRIRLHGAISQATSTTDELHQAADKNNATLTAEKQVRLQSALKLVTGTGGSFLVE